MARRIGLYPEIRKNAYQSQITKALEAENDVVQVPQIKWLALHRLKRVGTKLDVMLVSWFENTLVAHKTGRLRKTGVFQFRLKMWILKRLSHKLILVRHNEFPHRTRNADRAQVKALIDQLEKEFDAVITHSGHNIDGRFYVPHPLYESGRRGMGSEGQETPYCLAFGHILPYKNLLALVESWKGPCRLIIAGPGGNKDYLSRLRAAGNGKPVEIRVGFLPEEDAIELMSGAVCALLAHSGEDMIVSGSYFYAVSQGTPVYAVRTPFLHWLGTQNGPGLRCFDSVEQLAMAAGLLTGTAQSEVRARIVEHAERMFGAKALVGHLDIVMDSINV